MGWVAVERSWPHAARQRLRVWSAAVAVERRQVTIHRAGGAVRPAAPLLFRAPRGWSPGPLADEVRQGLGLGRVERGFPVVVPMAERIDRRYFE